MKAFYPCTRELSTESCLNFDANLLIVIAICRLNSFTKQEKKVVFGPVELERKCDASDKIPRATITQGIIDWG